MSSAELQDPGQVWATADRFIGELSAELDRNPMPTYGLTCYNAREACQAVKDGREGRALFHLLEMTVLRAQLRPQRDGDLVSNVWTWLRVHLTARLDRTETR